jgi:hypothetical protein
MADEEKEREGPRHDGAFPDLWERHRAQQECDIWVGRPGRDGTNPFGHAG